MKSLTYSSSPMRQRANSLSREGTLCAGDTHIWLNGSAICSCGQKWQRTYRLRGGWGENILILAGEARQASVSRGLAWLLDTMLHIREIIRSVRRQEK